jgi:long-subunit fatty acid transport protein
MTTKTLGSLILAGVLATSAAAAVQVIDPASVSGLTSSVRGEPAASDGALFVLGHSATAVNKQRPAGVVRITR